MIPLLLSGGGYASDCAKHFAESVGAHANLTSFLVMVEMSSGVDKPFRANEVLCSLCLPWQRRSRRVLHLADCGPQRSPSCRSSPEGRQAASILSMSTPMSSRRCRRSRKRAFERGFRNTEGRPNRRSGSATRSRCRFGKRPEAGCLGHRRQRRSHRFAQCDDPGSDRRPRRGDQCSLCRPDTGC
jgi:hypothetical protein